MTEEQWSIPKEVSDLDVTFGGRSEELLPPIDVIPSEFWEGSTKWNKLASDIFYGRELKGELQEKVGIDVHFAARHIRAVLASFQPKHEHKMAGCAFLLSQFYKEVTY